MKKKSKNIWVVAFNSAGFSAATTATDEEHAPEFAKYFRRYYPSVKILDEKEMKELQEYEGRLRNEH